MIEEKTYSITIHYRQVRDKRRALRTIARAVEELRDARIVAGSQTVTLMPKGGPDKGVALQRAQRMFHCDRALYVGDDDADEDAFASSTTDRLLAIRVGSTRRSAARYRLQRQSAIDSLLEGLIDLRSTTSAQRPTARRPSPRSIL